MRIYHAFAVIATAFVISCGNDVEEFVPPTPGGTDGNEEQEQLLYHEKAKEMFDIINQYYKVTSGPTAGLYTENYPKKASDGAASTLWPYDGLISGVAALYELGYDVDYLGMVDKFEVYWRESGVENVGGYGSATNGVTGSGDRFYDDNSIEGIELVQAYELTGESTYLERAGRIVDFLKAGEDDVFDGGLWWNESLKNMPGNSSSNKPACANGYATNFLLRYYNVCPEEEKADVLAFARRLYDWIVKNLRDPADYCYWNDRQASGEIYTVKWTYNTGVMISNGIALYKITGDKTYLDEATASAQGAYNYFVRPHAASGMALAYPNHDPWFTTKLIISYIELVPYYKNAESYINTFTSFLDHAWDEARMADGRFYEYWTGVPDSGQDTSRSDMLLMQDAALESLGIIALYKGEKADQEQ